LLISINDIFCLNYLGEFWCDMLSFCHV